MDCTETVPNSTVTDHEWTTVGSKGGGVVVYERKISGYSLKAFAGEISVDAPISMVLGAFVNTSHTLKWADSIKTMEVMPLTLTEKLTDDAASTKKSIWQRLLNDRKQKSGTLAQCKENQIADKLSVTSEISDLVYQMYEMWPLPSRDFLFLRHFKVHEHNHSVIVHYQSHTDRRKPVLPHTIRTKSPFTIWTFQPMYDFCQAKIRSKVESKGQGFFSRIGRLLTAF